MSLKKFINIMWRDEISLFNLKVLYCLPVSKETTRSCLQISQIYNNVYLDTKSNKKICHALTFLDNNNFIEKERLKNLGFYNLSEKGLLCVQDINDIFKTKEELKQCYH